MIKKSEDIIKRIDQLIEKGKELLTAIFTIQYRRGSFVNYGRFTGYRSTALSLLRNVLGEDHVYYVEFKNGVSSNVPARVEAGIEILKSVKEEIEGGWLFTIKGLVSAEIFADFLDMATYLLESDYKDPAAVMIGSVLEEHLRQLCNKNGISIEVSSGGKTKPKKADLMNADLTKAGVYNKLEQKQVTAWLDLRNKAAHGEYEEYKKEQVETMLSGVRDFINRNSL